MKNHTHIVTVGLHTKHLLAPLRVEKPDEIIIAYMLDYKNPERRKYLDEVKKTVEEARYILQDTLGYKKVKVLEIKEWRDIERLFSKEDTIFSINLTGARKLLALMLYSMAASIPKKVKAIYYVHGDGMIEEMPITLPAIRLSDKELLALKTRASSLREVHALLDKSKSFWLKILKSLDKKGLISYIQGKISRKPLVIEGKYYEKV